MRGDRQTIAFAADLRHLGKTHPKGRPNRSLVGPVYRERKDGIPQQTKVPQDVVAVFRSHANHRLSVGRGKRAVGTITYIREKVAPLRHQQIRQIEPLRLGP